MMNMTKITISRKKFKIIQKILFLVPVFVTAASASKNNITFTVSKAKLLYLQDIIMGI